MLKDIIKLKKQLSGNKVKGIALDIDETLSFTLNNWFPRLQEKFGNPEGLNTIELIRKYRYVQNVPYWRSPEVFEWVVENVYNDALQEELEVIGEADKYLPRIHKIKPVVAYISNRPVEVAKGTQAWLKKHGFPNAPLLLRPNYIHYSLANNWKATVLDFLYPEIEGYVDDNYNVLTHLPEDYPGHIFLYDMKEYDSKIKNVHPCPTWESVYLAIKQTFK